MTRSHTGLQPLTIPAHENFTHALARLILQHHSDALPDLHQVHVILPNAQAVQQFRLSLTQLSETALIGGYCGSLGQWLETHTDLPGESLRPVNQSARQLLLIEALKAHPELFAVENHWQVCDSLLTLFDELPRLELHVANNAVGRCQHHGLLLAGAGQIEPESGRLVGRVRFIFDLDITAKIGPRATGAMAERCHALLRHS